jgi:hypothetical protein
MLSSSSITRIRTSPLPLIVASRLRVRHRRRDRRPRLERRPRAGTAADIHPAAVCFDDLADRVKRRPGPVTIERARVALLRQPGRVALDRQAPPARAGRRRTRGRDPPARESKRGVGLDSRLARIAEAPIRARRERLSRINDFRS